MDASTDPHQQFVWGQRYIDDCVLRDRDTTGNGTLDERLYAMQDANWNVTAIVDATGAVQERFAYSAYGDVMFLNASFAEQASSSHNWERLCAGYVFDADVAWYAVRNRVYIPQLGWVQRDPLGYVNRLNLYEYCGNQPLICIDPNGELALITVVFIGACIGAAAGGGLAACQGGSTTEIVEGALAGAAIGSVVSLAVGGAALAAGLSGTATIALEGGATVTVGLTAAQMAELTVGAKACFAITATIGIVHSQQIDWNLVMDEIEIGATNAATVSPCVFYYAWCLWGIYSREPRNRRWRTTSSNCRECYAECVSRGGAWPMRKCYMGRPHNGPRYRGGGGGSSWPDFWWPQA